MLDKIFNYLEGLTDKLPDTTLDCDGTILCERVGRRHKSDCIGRTINIDLYVRKLKSL